MAWGASGWLAKGAGGSAASLSPWITAAAAYAWGVGQLQKLMGPGYGPLTVWTRGAGHRPIHTPPDISGARFYAAFDESVIDNGGGSYTGTGSEDIVFPPDIARYLLVEMGFDSVTSYITTGAATFGSFDTARTDINALVTGDWEVIARYTQTDTIGNALRGLTYQAPITFWRSQLDNNMKAQVYKTTPASQDYFQDLDAATYKWKYTEDMIEDSVIVGFTPKSEIVNEVHVRFGLYAPTGEYTKDAWVGPTGSDDGSGAADEGAAGGREEQATDSQTQFNIKNTLTIYAEQIYRPEMAVVLRNTLFDRFQRPRILVQFDTWGRATAMDLHTNTLIHNELADYVPVPKYNYSGAAIEWDDLIFYVRKKRIFNDNGRIRHRILLEEVPQPL